MIETKLAEISESLALEANRLYRILVQLEREKSIIAEGIQDAMIIFEDDSDCEARLAKAAAELEKLSRDVLAIRERICSVPLDREEPEDLDFSW